MINRQNYDKVISEFGVENLNEILKAQHQNYLSIVEFYNDDDGIRNTIEEYFRKLERFINKYKEAESEKIVKRSQDSPEIKEAKKAAETYPSLDTEMLKKIHLLETSHITEHGESEASTIRLKALEKELAKREKQSKGSVRTNKKNISKAKPEPKKPKVKVAKKSGKRVKHLSEEIKVIRKFVGLHDKEKSKDSILNFIKGLQRSLTKGMISKKSSLIKWIGKIERSLIHYYNSMGSSNIISIPDKELAQFVAIAGGEEVYKSIPIISYYIGLKGKQPDETKLANFINRVDKAISSGKVGQDDPYQNTVKGILRKLKKYKPGSSVEIDKQELNGLEGILNACGCKQDLGKIYDTKGKSLRKCKKKTYSDARKGACSHNKGLAGLGEAMTAEQIANMNFVLLPFTGIWKELFGQPEKNFSMMFHGEPGAGKSTFLVKFAKFLSSLGSVLYVTSEEYGSVTLKNLVNKYLNPFPGNIVFVPNLDATKPGDYDFVIFDSITDAGLKLDDYKKLKAENPETGFLLVLQHTKDGQFKGGKEWEHEAQIVGKIEQGNIEIYKNRYGVKNSWYFFEN